MPDTIDVGVVALVQPPAAAAAGTSYTPTLSVQNNTPYPLYLQGTLEIRDSQNVLVYAEPISASGQIAAGATAPLSATKAWTPLVAGTYSVSGTVYAGAADVSGSVTFGPYAVIVTGAAAPGEGAQCRVEATLDFYVGGVKVNTIRYPNYLSFTIRYPNYLSF